MSDDKIGNKTGSEGLSETDKGYYEDLYNDLPKEVVDILMQTHPLMGKNDDLEATAYRARRPQRREDVEEVKEAMMQQVGNEINEVSRSTPAGGRPYPLRFPPRKKCGKRAYFRPEGEYN